jgi:ribosomal protein L11 methyltransferase
MTQAVRIEIPPAQAAVFEENEDFLEGLGGLEFSSAAAPGGGLRIWVASADVEEALTALAALGARGLSTFEEETTDWVSASAALRKAVLVERYLFDPHDGKLATPAPAGARRLYLPAVRAFGTGSHESTRLAVRLLLGERLAGARVLDVGCGTGTLAFVAALEGAAHVVALDIDREAAFAAREQARANRVPHVRVLAAPLDALARGTRFETIVANLIHEEIAPLLPALRAHVAPGGRLLCSGQLVERRGEWKDLLRREGFRLVRSIAENEWLGTAWVSSNE